MHPSLSPARVNFTLMTECTPESSGCYSVYSVVQAVPEGVYVPEAHIMYCSFYYMALVHF